MSILNLSTKLVINRDFIDSPNLCDRLPKEDLTRIGEATWEGYSRDLSSRSKWMKRMEAAMDLALQIQQPKNFPWPGSANVVFPLVTISALQFSARSYGNIIQGTDVVRYRVIGDDTSGDTQDRADRISKHMSWQVLEEDSSWEEQHDRLLINLAIVGANFVKTYFSPTLGHNVSELVMARDLVLDYYAKSVEAAARKTHVVPLYRNEIYERVMSDIFQDVRDEPWFNAPAAAVAPQPSARQDIRQGLSPPPSDEDTPFRSLEQHRLLDLDGDGYAEPYIVTIEETSKAVLRIVARFDREEAIERTLSKKILRIRPTEYFTKYSFIPAPDGGIYDVGFGILLGPLNESVNTGINQLLDSGTMQNSMGGFLGRGAKIRGGQYTMAPWEWKRVDSTGDDLRKNMVPYPERQPSVVMFQLLGLLIEYTDRIAGTTDQMVGMNPGQNTPAETSRNTMEQGMQVYSMIFKRVWRSMKEEFKKLHILNATYLPGRKRFGAGESYITQEDYRGNPDMVVPVADPNVTSVAMRFFQANAVRTAAMQVPGYSLPDVEKNFLRALRVEGIDKLYPGADKVPPLPNPKAAVEQLKLQGKQMELDNEKQMFIITLQSNRRKVLAEIALLEAQAISLMAGIQDDQAATRIKAFDTVIASMKTHAETLGLQAQQMSGEKDGKGKSDGGGVPGMEGQPGNAPALPAPSGMAGGAEGAMGGGNVSGGG